MRQARRMHTQLIASLPGALLAEALLSSADYGVGSFGMHLADFVSAVILFQY
jgi:hypothetical protein